MLVVQRDGGVLHRFGTTVDDGLALVGRALLRVGRRARRRIGGVGAVVGRALTHLRRRFALAPGHRHDMVVVHLAPVHARCGFAATPSTG